MNIQSLTSHKFKARSHWVLFAVYIVLIFATEPFYRQPLFDLSISFIERVQGQDPKNNNFLIFAKSISFLGYGIFLPIIFLVFNYANIYKTFVLLMSLLLSTMQISLLKMIYLSPRPYWVSKNIIPIDCEAGWGNPSGHSLASTAFYLTLWHIVFDCSQLRDKKTVKYVSLCFTAFFILLIMFSRNFVGAHSLNQILFGCLLGLSIYFFIFYVLCVRVNDHKQFANFLEFKNVIYGSINFFIFLFGLLVYYFNRNEEEFSKWNDLIAENGCGNIPENKRLHNESLIALAIFLSNFGAFIGIKMDYHFSFTGNLQNYIQYNFEVDERGDDESLMTKITINKETQWNHTNSFFSLMRLFISLLISTVIVIPFYFISWEDNIYVVLIFKVLLPLSMANFSLFFLFKTILKSLRLVNLTLFSMLQDSL